LTLGFLAVAFEEPLCLGGPYTSWKFACGAQVSAVEKKVAKVDGAAREGGERELSKKRPEKLIPPQK
jgi:hypothetical protein